VAYSCANGALDLGRRAGRFWWAHWPDPASLAAASPEQPRKPPPWLLWVCRPGYNNGQPADFFAHEEKGMAVLRVALVGCLLLAVASVALAGKGKIDKDKLVGTWTFAKATPKEEAPPEGAEVKVTFTKDGKMTMTMTHEGKTRKQEGSYTVKGDQLATVLKGPGGKDRKETLTIKELTDKKLVIDATRGGKTATTEWKK
jgi:uncharacterized protein (TIGR03066 family)